MFEVVIENIKEEFEVIDEFENLEDAINKAKQIPPEDYKSIRIDKLNEEGKLVKIIELEVK